MAGLPPPPKLDFQYSTLPPIPDLPPPPSFNSPIDIQPQPMPLQTVTNSNPPPAQPANSWSVLQVPISEPPNNSFYEKQFDEDYSLNSLMDQIRKNEQTGI